MSRILQVFSRERAIVESRLLGVSFRGYQQRRHFLFRAAGVTHFAPRL